MNLKDHVGNIIKVTWKDSKGGGHWEFIEDYNPSVVDVITIGKLVSAEDDFILIASTFTDDQMMAPICIPCCCIEHFSIWEENKTKLLQEDIDSVHILLDERGVPRDSDSHEYSIIGRINQLLKNYSLKG